MDGISVIANLIIIFMLTFLITFIIDITKNINELKELIYEYNENIKKENLQ